MSSRIVGSIIHTNIAYAGHKQITGTVTGVNGKRKIRLYDRSNGQLVAETWSNNASGAYSFVGLAGSPQEYYVIGIDYLDVWNLAAADRPLLGEMV